MPKIRNQVWSKKAEPRTRHPRGRHQHQGPDEGWIGNAKVKEVYPGLQRNACPPSEVPNGDTTLGGYRNAPKT